MIYEKLQKCRVELQNMNLKKSGNNKFAGYDYYELADFLPTINNLMLDNKMCSVVAFTNELATLTIIDTEDKSEAVFTSPMAQASLKGCHDIQNLGAVQTYQRRYLYMNAFEIVEHDALDGTPPKEEPKGFKNLKETAEAIEQITKLITDKQARELLTLAEETKADVEQMKKFYKVNDFTQLSEKQYKSAKEYLEKKKSA